MRFASCADPARRRRLAEMQGFTGLDDRTLAQVDPWLRLAPAICMAWAGVGTALGSALVLAALIPFAAGGAIGPRHPFDYVYELGVRPRLGTPQIPRYGAPRRFACALASVWLAAAAAAFYLGAATLGTLLGASLVLAAAFPTFAGFCIPSWIYTRLLHPQAAPARRGEGTVAP
jgi:hypothetical protein